ncbi:xanthine dehydrogenase [Pseudomonas putida]|jgi:xanthine/CO dehydrogenase XdhC/CoxF family maturation factor|uniref:Xanthine dehydrogenase n=1 Tax=Pseudomonas putida TaxID=303 RepID=A0A0N8HH30_PSEPU|nr:MULTISPECIES: XdhC/CoxI family protein [Pseudomonas]KPM68628.1 xanthine dehydrogenase [Pseudomonas putida]MCS7747831.1 XdhC family protein [Pseudomonas aeruginosa]MCS8000818.1 XdhC family protein [Pseudomonas aeruginosa]MCS9648564.1 XdhC family protein [Pseudomonas aeruginosa]RNF91539.1 XdhC/CoxI family protein [Pseudomonas putida]
MLTGISALLDAVATVTKYNREAVLATLVKIEGSSYRQPGARMLVPIYGASIGTISGGCLESEVAKKAWWLTDRAEAVVRRYSTDAQDDDDDSALTFGLGCNGTVHVMLQRHSAKKPLPAFELLHLVRRSGRPGVLASVIACQQNASIRVGDQWLLHPDHSGKARLLDSTLDDQVQADLTDTLSHGRSILRIYSTSQGEVEIFHEYIAPQQRLVIFGAGHDALPLVHMAKLLDWHVTVIDGRTHFARSDRFPNADAVLQVDARPPYTLHRLTDHALVAVMTHSYSQDRHWLKGLLQGNPTYIGQLGPRARTERLLAEICTSTAKLSALKNFHYPMGLDIGGETPESVALAILAEMTAVLSQRSGGMLKYRKTDIHISI